MFASLINTFANCFKIPELKSRIFFTLVILGVCRLAAMIPIPGLAPSRRGNKEKTVRQWFVDRDLDESVLVKYCQFQQIQINES